MPKVLVNLTFLAINNEIDQFLFDFQDYSKLGLTEFELRMKLMRFVLPRCEERFKWVEKTDQFPYAVKIPSAPLTQRLAIEDLIHKAMDLFWQENHHSLPQESQTHTRHNADSNADSIDEL